MGNKNSGRIAAPAQERTVPVTIRVRVPDWERIESLSAREGITASQWVRALVRLSLDSHPDPLAAVRAPIPTAAESAQA